MTRTRALLALPLALTALAAVSACNATSYTSSCSDGVCTVTLTGAGADAEVNGGALTVELAGAADGSADLVVDGESATCAQDEELEVAGWSVVCTEVGDDRVTVEIR